MPRAIINFAAVLLCLLLGACATAHPGTRIEVASATHIWVDEILNGEAGQPQRIFGQLSVPTSATAPMPAIVLIHSAQGRDSQIWMYAERFNEMGIAMLALDSFTQRGIERIMLDQTEVTEASMIADAYAALHLLAEDPRIDPNRIGIFGISKGGAPTIYAGIERVAEALAPDGARFAVHIAYYPWCGVRFLDPATTGAPLLIQTGARDFITPAAHCRDLLVELEAYNPGLEAELVVHEGARHAFDHPRLAYVPAIPTGYLTPARCLFREVEPGSFVEESENTAVTGANLSAALEACSRKGFLAGGNRQAATAAWARTAQYLQDYLLDVPDTLTASIPNPDTSSGAQ